MAGGARGRCTGDAGKTPETEDVMARKKSGMANYEKHGRVNVKRINMNNRVEMRNGFGI